MIHRLKTWPRYFNEVAYENKRIEVRKNDRGFSLGDVLCLKEWDPAVSEYTGAEVCVYVTYILSGSVLTRASGVDMPEWKAESGLLEGYCVMQIQLLRQEVRR